jgi:hypothetical protein
MSRRSDWLKKHMQAEGLDEPDADGLRRRSIVVTDKGGTPTPAMLMRCPCGGEKFLVYFIDTHQHCQCTICGTSFCDGSCSQ